MADSADPLPKVELAGGYSRRFPHRGHYLRHVAIAVGVFIASCAIIRALLPFPEIDEVTPKLRYFAAHKDEFDTLFIGSSHIYRDINPVTFDRIVAGHGIQVRSFNLALGGMLPPESLYYLEQALRAEPRNLKWVLVELQEVQSKWPKDKRETQRFLYWHNWPLTRSTIVSAVDPERQMNPGQFLVNALRSRTAAVHFATFIKNVTNVGGARDFQDWDARQKRANTNEEEFVVRQGHTPLENPMSATDAAEYSRQLDRWIERARARPVDAVTDDAYRECARLISSHGAKPLFILTPNPVQSILKFRGETDAPGPILVFNEANQYPELYEPRVRADVQHLTGEGAEIFTRLLAERFAREIATGAN